MRAFIFAFCLVPLATAAAPAAKAPIPAAHPPRIEELFRSLAGVESEEEAKPIEQQIEALFLQSGSPTVDLLMTRGAAALQAGDSKTAGQVIEAVTRVAPNFAEGWHQRSQLQALAGDDAGAMISLQRTVALNPREFTALSQLADMLEDYGKKAAALKVWRRVKAVNPHADQVDRHIRLLSREVEGQGI